MNLTRIITLTLTFFTFFAANLYADEAKLCVIGPRSRAAVIRIQCEKGESKNLVDAASDTEIESDDSFHLLFKKSLFNTKRIIHIQDSITDEEALTIEVTAPHQAIIRSSVQDRTWILDGLASAHLDQLTIETH